MNSSMTPSYFSRQQTAQAELEPAEYLLWTGSPDPVRSTRLSLLIFIIAIPWTGFALVWTGLACYAALAAEEFFAIVFPLFGIPFIAVGFGMLAMPFKAYRQAKNTVYAITSHRAMIIVTGRPKTVESISGHEIGSIKRVERAGGTGDLVFVDFEEGEGGRAKKEVGFFGIPNVASVERIFRDAFKTNNQRSAHS